MEHTNPLYDRYQRVASRLNLEAYRLQMAGRTKPLKQFIPCERALVFTGACGKNPIPVMFEVVMLAGAVKCQCHPGMTEKDVLNIYLEFLHEKPTP